MVKITAYQAKFLANYLTRRLPANDLNKLTASLQDAQVDLTPHQVEAAAFAFKSPLSKGAILAEIASMTHIDYREFLQRRRELMADKIHKYYDSI